MSRPGLLRSKSCLRPSWGSALIRLWFCLRRNCCLVVRCQRGSLQFGSGPPLNSIPRIRDQSSEGHMYTRPSTGYSERATSHASSTYSSVGILFITKFVFLGVLVSGFVCFSHGMVSGLHCAVPYRESSKMQWISKKSERLDFTTFLRLARYVWELRFASTLSIYAY